MLVLALVM
jgi:hypothetical protein